MVALKSVVACLLGPMLATAADKAVYAHFMVWYSMHVAF